MSLFVYLQSSGRGKRVISNVKEDDKPQEVVHVRARRGQATDSHSLAERVGIIIYPKLYNKITLLNKVLRHI